MNYKDSLDEVLLIIRTAFFKMIRYEDGTTAIKYVLHFRIL
jgi:hypothetical protein